MPFKNYCKNYFRNAIAGMAILALGFNLSGCEPTEMAKRNRETVNYALQRVKAFYFDDKKRADKASAQETANNPSAQEIANDSPAQETAVPAQKMHNSVNNNVNESLEDKMLNQQNSSSAQNTSELEPAQSSKLKIDSDLQDLLEFKIEKHPSYMDLSANCSKLPPNTELLVYLKAAGHNDVIFINRDGHLSGGSLADKIYSGEYPASGKGRFAGFIAPFYDSEVFIITAEPAKGRYTPQSSLSKFIFKPKFSSLTSNGITVFWNSGKYRKVIEELCGAVSTINSCLPQNKRIKRMLFADIHPPVDDQLNIIKFNPFYRRILGCESFLRGDSADAPKSDFARKVMITHEAAHNFYYAVKPGTLKAAYKELMSTPGPCRTTGIRLALHYYFDESFYEAALPGSSGHPFSDHEELFASGTAVMMNYPDTFVKAVNDLKAYKGRNGRSSYLSQHSVVLRVAKTIIDAYGQNAEKVFSRNVLDYVRDNQK